MSVVCEPAQALCRRASMCGACTASLVQGDQSPDPHQGRAAARSRVQRQEILSSCSSGMRGFRHQGALTSRQVRQLALVWTYPAFPQPRRRLAGCEQASSWGCGAPVHGGPFLTWAPALCGLCCHARCASDLNGSWASAPHLPSCCVGAHPWACRGERTETLPICTHPQSTAPVPVAAIRMLPRGGGPLAVLHGSDWPSGMAIDSCSHPPACQCPQQALLWLLCNEQVVLCPPYPCAVGSCCLCYAAWKTCACCCPAPFPAQNPPCGQSLSQTTSQLSATSCTVRSPL